MAMQEVIVPVERSKIAKAAQARDKPEKPYEVRADKPMGLLLRIQPSGTRTFYVQVGRGRRVKIGAVPLYTLQLARERAKRILLNPAEATAARKSGASATLAEYLDDSYADHAKAKLKNGDVTLSRVKTVWKSLLNKRMSDITASDVDRLRNKRVLAGIADATVNRDVAALSGVFSHWTANTKGAAHPLRGLAPLKVADDETIRYLTPAENKRLRKALADRDAQAAKERANANKWRVARGYEPMAEINGYADHLTPMVLLSLNLGLRQGELFQLDWANIDLERKTVTVLASHSKGNTTRTIPLNAEALAVLTAIRPEVAQGLVFKSPVTGGEFDNVRKAWADVTKAAKLPDLRWHDLRHCFASALVMRGVPLYAVQRLLGHANSKMTQRYARLAPDALADAVELLGA